MSILWEKLPNTLFIDKDRLINTDFRVMLKFESIMNDKEIFNEDKILLALKLFYKDYSFINEDNLKMVIEGLLWFYSAGKYEENSTSNNKNSNKKVFSFEYDAKYILAAFKQQFNIDLTETNMHWWKFKALFDGLSSDCELMKIIGYRSMNIDSNMSSEEKKRYRSLKRLYALPDERTEEEKERDFANALFG